MELQTNSSLDADPQNGIPFLYGEPLGEPLGVGAIGVAGDSQTHWAGLIRALSASL